MERKIKVTVWNEYRHERENESIRKIYPEGILAKTDVYHQSEIQRVLENAVRWAAPISGPKHFMVMRNPLKRSKPKIMGFEWAKTATPWLMRSSYVENLMYGLVRHLIIEHPAELFLK